MDPEQDFKLDLKDVFGVNVLAWLTTWFNGEFTTMFNERWHQGMTLVVLNTDDFVELMQGWRDPLKFAMINFYIGGRDEALKTDGTRDNVAGKLRWVLRHLWRSMMANSVHSETKHDQVRVGDFTWEGAGLYRGYIGGVSGLKKKEDWMLFCFFIDKLIELLDLVNTAAMQKADELRKQPDCPEGVKYLIGINVADQFPEQWRAAA